MFQWNPHFQLFLHVSTFQAHGTMQTTPHCIVKSGPKTRRFFTLINGFVRCVAPSAGVSCFCSTSSSNFIGFSRPVRDRPESVPCPCLPPRRRIAKSPADSLAEAVPCLDQTSPQHHDARARKWMAPVLRENSSSFRDLFSCR